MKTWWFTSMENYSDLFLLRTISWIIMNLFIMNLIGYKVNHMLPQVPSDFWSRVNCQVMLMVAETWVPRQPEAPRCSEFLPGWFRGLWYRWRMVNQGEFNDELMVNEWWRMVNEWWRMVNEWWRMMNEWWRMVKDGEGNHVFVLLWSFLAL